MRAKRSSKNQLTLPKRGTQAAPLQGVVAALRAQLQSVLQQAATLA